MLCLLANQEILHFQKAARAPARENKKAKGLSRLFVTSKSLEYETLRTAWKLDQKKRFRRQINDILTATLVDAMDLVPQQTCARKFSWNSSKQGILEALFLYLRSRLLQVTSTIVLPIPTSVVLQVMPKAANPSPRWRSTNHRSKLNDENYHSSRTERRVRGLHPKHSDIFGSTSFNQLQGPPADPNSPELKGLNRLIHQVDCFQAKVEALVSDFEGVREALEEAERQFEGLEMDYRLACEAVMEEKLTSHSYHGQLKNAEVEIEHLRMALPEDYNGPAIGGFSQAKY
ncbi:hypothetical protein MD484_g311, partial [Candolleomyces efflorescens]